MKSGLWKMGMREMKHWIWMKFGSSTRWEGWKFTLAWFKHGFDLNGEGEGNDGVSRSLCRLWI